MNITEGNIFDMPGIKCVTTNGIIKKDGTAVMGAGIAKIVALRNPWMPARLGALLKEYGNRAFNLGRGWASLPTKHHWKQDSDIELIKTSCEQLMAMADKFGWDAVYLPAPGVGMGKLNWPEVQLVIEQILDDRFTVVLYRKEG